MSKEEKHPHIERPSKEQIISVLKNKPPLYANYTLIRICLYWSLFRM